MSIGILYGPRTRADGAQHFAFIQRSGQSDLRVDAADVVGNTLEELAGKKVEFHEGTAGRAVRVRLAADQTAPLS